MMNQANRALCLENLNRNPYPKQIILDIHSYCNARCIICPYDFLKSKIPMGVMEESLFKKIIDDFAEIARKNNFIGKVLFCNMGELFFYPDIALNRIKYVMHAGLEFNIQTNAAMLSPKVVDPLIETGFDGSILISCHGISPNVYRKIMGLKLSKTLGNIDYLIRKYPKEKIGIQSIPYHWPRKESMRVRHFWRKKGIDVRMPLPNNRGGLLLEIKQHHKKKLLGCSAGRPLGEMVICYNGDVILCCNDMKQQEKVGSLETKSIEEVWNGTDMMEKVAQIYCGKDSGDDFICKKCEFGKTSSSIIYRFIKNIRYETEKIFFKYIW